MGISASTTIISYINSSKMTRDQVYNLIDGERDYQDTRWNFGERNGIPDSQKHAADWLNYIDHCLQEAKKADYFLNGPETMANIRKIAGLAVVAMEVLGAPPRVVDPNLFKPATPVKIHKKSILRSKTPKKKATKKKK